MKEGLNMKNRKNKERKRERSREEGNEEETKLWEIACLITNLRWR